MHFDCAGSHKVCAAGGSPSSSGSAAFSPACQVKASRFYQGYFVPPAFSSSGSSSQPRAPDLGTARFDREVQSSVGTSGPQPRAPDLSGALPTSAASRCDTECQKRCQIECQNRCQIEYQKICQIEFQIGCQNICQVERQKKCPIE